MDVQSMVSMIDFLVRALGDDKWRNNRISLTVKEQVTNIGVLDFLASYLAQ